LDRPELLPEGIHVDDQVLDHRQVAHRRDDRHMALVDQRLDRRLARQHRGASSAASTVYVSTPPVSVSGLYRWILRVTCIGSSGVVSVAADGGLVLGD